jgi:outer membrane lipoprotein-sorting protein
MRARRFTLPVAIALCCALSTTGFSQEPARSDEASDKLLDGYYAAVAKVKSVRMNVAIDGQGDGVGPTRKVRGYIAIKRPSMVRSHLPCKVQERTEEYACDGKQGYIFSSDSESCHTGPAAVFLKKLEGPETFFLSNARVRDAHARLGAPHIVGQPTPIGGVLCKALEFLRDGDYLRLYIGTDNLPRGADVKTGGLVSQERYTELKVNKTIPPSLFQWRPPAKIRREPIPE